MTQRRFLQTPNVNEVTLENPLELEEAGWTGYSENIFAQLLHSFYLLFYFILLMIFNLELNTVYGKKFVKNLSARPFHIHHNDVQHLHLESQTPSADLTKKKEIMSSM